MQRHWKRHNGEKPYKCDICGKSSKDNLKQHKLKVHSQTKPFECDICKKRFNKKRSMQCHWKRHNGCVT